MFALFRWLVKLFWPGNRNRAPPEREVVPGLLTEREVYEGILVFGGIGSGKTSGPGRALAEGLYRLGCGILVLTAKPDETERWKRLAKDAIIFGPGNACFDFISYELNQPGGSIESVAQLLDMLVQVGSRSSGKNSEPFWESYAARINRRALAAIYHATGKCSIEDMYAFMLTAPPTLHHVHHEELEEWREGSFCMQILASECTHPDFKLAKAFWQKDYPTTSEKLRSSGIAIASTVLDKFLSHPIKPMVCGETTVSPDAVLNGKVVIIDMPVLMWREAGQFLQIIWKTCLQRAALRRVDPAIPVVLWADECQFFCTEADQMAMTVSRQAKLINVCLTQTIPTLLASMGGEKARAEVDSWTGLFQTKIFAQNSCPVTNEYASRLIGQTRQLQFGGSSSNQPFDIVKDWMGENQHHMSWNEHILPEVRPEEFTRLVKGGKGKVETIAYKSGQWCRYWFSQ